MRGGSVSDDVTLGLAGGIGVFGLDVSGTLSRSTYELTNIDLSVTAFAVTVGVSLNPKNGVSLQALQGAQIGVGGIVGLQFNVIGSKFGGAGALDYGLSYEKTSGAFVGAKAQANLGVLGLGELDGQVKFGKAFSPGLPNPIAPSRPPRTPGARPPAARTATAVGKGPAGLRVAAFARSARRRSKALA
jgi:hypothetical protein